MDFIRTTVVDKKIDCYVAVESWLTKHHSDELLSIDGFLSFRDDRLKRCGGGVIIWTRHCFSPISLPISNKPEDIECAAVILRSSRILLLACYIPPVPAVSKHDVISLFFISIIDDFLNANPSFSIIICGDLNRFDISTICKNCDLINSYSGSTYGSVQLDYILISEKLSHSYRVSDCVPFDFSSVPHKSLLATPFTSDYVSREFSIPRSFFDLRESHVNDFVVELCKCDWDFIYNPTCPFEEKCSLFYSILFEVFHRTIPTYSVSFSSRDKPWITPLVKHLINCRWQAYRSRDFALYKHLKVKILNEITNAKKKWVNNMVPKNIWKVFRTLSSKKSNAPLLSLYSQFSSIATAADSINVTLSEVFSKSDFSHLIACSPSGDTFVTPATVFTMLRHLPRRKSSPDIPCILFQAAAHVISEPLAHLFNLSLSLCFVPGVFKNSIVTPIPKISAPTIRDLRPISLLPIPMKLLEKVLLSHYKPLFVSNYGPEQYGFRPGSSTTCALIRIFDFVTRQLDKPDVSGVQIVSYDFTKAFDKLKFDVIVQRLIECNFPYPLICWLVSFMSDRKQCVRIGDTLSNCTEVTSGVPQGSVLGPYIFGVVAGSFLSNNDSCLLVKFADDFTFCFPIFRHADNSHVSLQHSRLLAWSDHTSLPLNISKCKSLLISTTPNCTGIDLDNVANVKMLTLLGITVNSKCSWNNHIDKVVTLASRRLYPLRFIREHVPVTHLLTLYNSFVRCLFDYCAPLFVGMSKTCAKRLDLIQRRFHRMLCGKSCSKDCLPKLEDRRKDLSLRFLKKIMCKDHLLHQLLPPLLPSGRFLMPTRRTKRYSDSFILFICKLHNSLHKR